LGPSPVYSRVQLFDFSDFVPQGEDGQTLYTYIERLADGSGHRCLLCGVTKDRRWNVWKHVENLHFPGTYTYTCKHCGETCSTRDRLNSHVTKYHAGLSTSFS
jgi:hypothetical protein